MPIPPGADMPEQPQPTGQAGPDLAAELQAAALDWAALAERDPPPRAYAWCPWIPRRRTTLLHGFGSAGKTLLAQQIGTAYALAIDLFGGATEGRRTLFVAGEDDHDEIWRRAVDICRRLGIKLTDIVGKVDVLAVPHIDMTIAEANEVGAVMPTPMLDVLRQRIEQFKPGLSIFDNSAKLFAIREGDRIGITRAVGLLDAICHDFDTSALLVAHDNKLGEFSGSTAWENACRSRLHLTRDPENGTTILEMPKANYASTGRLVLRWDDWSFRADDPAMMTPGERLEAGMRRGQIKQAVLDFIDQRNAQMRPLSAAPQAQTYLPKVMANGQFTRREIEQALEALFNDGTIIAKIRIGWRADRNPIYGIARASTEGAP